jgi:hypothetical protein
MIMFRPLKFRVAGFLAAFGGCDLTVLGRQYSSTDTIRFSDAHGD